MEAAEACDYLEWIDPQEFTNVKHIADGGFGSLYHAIWKNAPVERLKFVESLKDGYVTLKVTNGNTSTFLTEVNAIKISNLSFAK